MKEDMDALQKNKIWYLLLDGRDRIHEKFLPVVKLVYVCIVLALVALLDLVLEKYPFLYGDLYEKIYME